MNVQNVFGAVAKGLLGTSAGVVQAHMRPTRMWILLALDCATKQSQYF